ncbi:MAG: hypothetical protein ACLGIV_14625 [Actinomycetes bacterium]
MHPISDDATDREPGATPAHPAGGHEPDPAVVEAVMTVRDRFGAGGLRDMIALASAELTVVEEALAQLGVPEPPEADIDGPGPTA